MEPDIRSAPSLLGGGDLSAGTLFQINHLISGPPVELCHRRLVLFSVAITLATGSSIGYAQLVPKLPQLYAVLLRAAVWDCILVGVLVAQAADFAIMPFMAGSDGSHFFPLAVLFYHVFAFLVCAGNDLLGRMQARGRGRVWHRGLVLRRVLIELAGGASGSRLALGRVCFIVSGGAMWLALRALLWLGDEHWALSGFVIMLFAAYGAAGFAALEPRHTLPGHLVQYLCTGWVGREALVHGPVKLAGALLMLPFAFSVIAAHIWLRAVVFLVWIIVSCPCCHLRRSDDVYDAFGREVALPLLQCSFLAFSSTLASLVLGSASGQIAGARYVAAWVAAAYYTGMLLLWTSPMVLQAKVAFEEASDSRHAEYRGDPMLGGEDYSGQTEPLRAEATNMEGVELDDLKAGYEELRALQHRERHDHSIEVMQLQDKLRDAELRTRLAQRSLQDVEKERGQLEQRTDKLQAEAIDWQARCDELGTHLDKVSRRPSPRPTQDPGPAAVPKQSPAASPRLQAALQGAPPPPAAPTRLLAPKAEELKSSPAASPRQPPPPLAPGPALGDAQPSQITSQQTQAEPKLPQSDLKQSPGPSPREAAGSTASSQEAGGGTDTSTVAATGSLMMNTENPSVLAPLAADTASAAPAGKEDDSPYASSATAGCRQDGNTNSLDGVAGASAVRTPMDDVTKTAASDTAVHTSGASASRSHASSEGLGEASETTATVAAGEGAAQPTETAGPRNETTLVPAEPLASPVLDVPEAVDDTSVEEAAAASAVASTLETFKMDSDSDPEDNPWA